MRQCIWAKSFDTATLDSERNCEKSTFVPREGIVLKFQDHSEDRSELGTFYENTRRKQNEFRRSRYGRKLVGILETIIDHRTPVSCTRGDWIAIISS